MKHLFTLTMTIFMFGHLFSQTITSVSNGSWTMPTTWDCSCVPMPGSNVVINHTVTLTTNWGYTSGSITVNVNGSLIQDSSPRALAQNGGTFNNAGTVNLSKMAFFNGTLTNSGTLNAIDSLYLPINLTNTGTVISNNLYSSGTLVNNNEISGVNFFNDGNFTNNGQIQFANHYNNAVSHNDGTMTFTDYTNAGIFYNDENHTITMTNDCTNGDSLHHDAHWYNNGLTEIMHDFTNTDTLDGNSSGSFCVGSNSINSGAVLGNFDFCSQSGNFDVNTGTISNGITYCTHGISCWEGIASNTLSTINVFPNPVKEQLIITSSKEVIEKVEMVNLVGKVVYSLSEIQQQEVNISRKSFSSGIYFINVYLTNTVLVTKIIVE